MKLLLIYTTIIITFSLNNKKEIYKINIKTTPQLYTLLLIIITLLIQ